MSMWLGPPCPACGQQLDSLIRTSGRHDPDEPWQPDGAIAGPCGCRLSPEQAAALRTTREDT